MNLKKHIASTWLFLLPIFIILFFGACSTRKNTFPNRAYHTVTSKFNVTFNGKEALKSGEEELAKKSKENYTSLIPVYNYPAKPELGPIYPYMDKAIEKASKCIYKHSMFIRGKEYVKTIDDAYLIMGKAYFYKQDYVQANRIFNYIANTYKGWNCVEEAMILNARAAIQQKYYSRAQTLLDEVQYKIQEKKSKKLNVLFNAAMAEYQLNAPNGDYQLAIDYIQDAIKNKPKKEFTTRLYFILGQIHETMGQLPEAQNNFLKVIKRTPPYEMEFSAHMHLATNYDGTSSSRNTIMKELNKMLEEKKNENYKDQIYYAISEIERIDENKEEQIDHLKLSVSSYTDNDFQRTFSSIKLADIYFENEKYMDAQAYYDTAIISLPKNYPNHDEIVKKSKILKDLVVNLQEVMLQDSLQRIAKMSEGERRSWVNQRIEEFTAEERRLAKEEADRMTALQSSMSMGNVNINTSQSGKWYFYNPGLITSGQTEFYRKWGNRKLEDNWRISNKQQISFEDIATINDPSAATDKTEYDEEGNPIKQRETDRKKAEFYTQDLPLTKGAIDTSNQKIANALYHAGLIYMDQLQDTKRANESFENLYRRFPKHELSLPTLYLLYLNYLKLNDSKYERPKNIILNDYPETDYAKLILDPTYYQKLAEKAKEVEKAYEITYMAYSQKQWKETVKLVDQSLPKCTDVNLKSKFTYLRAVATGQIYGEDSLKKGLTDIIIQYSKTPVEDLARTYLSLFANSDKELAQAGDTISIKKTEATAEKEENPFIIAPDETHYIILIVNASTLPILDVKNNISAFNREFFSLQKYNINSFYINTNEQMVTIAKFKNKISAMDYYQIMTANDFFKNNVSNKNITIFAISSTNYTTYYNKSEKRYLYPDFFNVNYLNKK
ncbi:MAG: tetratricopeptide repeat protein [Bacteroidales bacterium]